MFDSTKEDLKDLLRAVDEGRIQLPEFQRSYVWGDEDVRSLIASVAKGFPVGALLTLQVGGPVNFQPRLITGVSDKDVTPDDLLLDGQQRMTSLYQATYSKRPVCTKSAKGTEVERYYYLDIKKAVAGGADIEEAIIGLPADRIVRKNFGREIDKDFSTREGEFEHDYFPLNQVFDSRNWFYDWRDYWRAKGRDISDLERNFDRGFVERIQRYKMPLIRLDKSNSREAICLVFEKLNVGGKKLDAFELVTAIYAAAPFDLRADWDGPKGKPKLGRRSRMSEHPNRRDVLTKVSNTEFLQACALLHTRDNRLKKIAEGVQGRDLPQVSCKREAVLALPLESYKAYADRVEKGFVEAARFLNEQKIIWHRDVPYPPQIMALAALFAITDRAIQSAAAKQKLSRWFWSITLGELYGSSTETRIAIDVSELVDWLAGTSGPPRSLDEAVFQQDRLRSLRQRLSAAYKGLHALMMRRGCQDFITGRPTDIMTFFNDRIDIHHVFPKDWCKKQGIKPSVFNSIVNKTPLSRASNIAISGDAPSVYLARIERKYGLSSAQLDAILRTHLIEPAHLRTNDFRAFFDARMDALAGVVTEAMEKPVVRVHGSNEAERDADEDLEDDFELEAA